MTNAEQMFPNVNETAQQLYAEHDTLDRELNEANQKYEQVLARSREEDTRAQEDEAQGRETIRMPRFRGPTGSNELGTIRRIKEQYGDNIKDAKKDYYENEGEYKLIAADDAREAGVQLKGVYGGMQKGLELMGDNPSDQPDNIEK